MNIITGYRGEPHITSAQDRAGNKGSYGTASYVLNVGSKFAATVISANEIRISDGILSHQGCLAIIETGTYDSVSINNGAQGMNRIDRIVARYTKDSETNVESVELAVIQGTATASTPVAPAYNQGTIATGSTPVDMPLYQVRLTGITVSSVTAEFSTVRTQKEMDTLLGNTSISGIGGGTVTGAISALNSNLELSITAAANVTISSASHVYLCGGKYLYLAVKGYTNAAVSNADLFSFSGDKNIIVSGTVPIGIGGEWNISSVGYGFIGAKKLVGTVPNATWFHVNMMVPTA